MKFKILPTIHLWTLIGRTSDNFWGGVQRTPTKRAQQVFSIKNIGEAKVSNLGSPVTVQQDVLKFQISVTDVVLKKKKIYLKKNAYKKANIK